MTSCPVCGIAAPWGCAICAAPDSPPAFAITRHSIRVNNLHRLVAALRQADLTRNDMCQRLGVGQTCLRYYMYELRPLVQVIEHHYNSPRSYRLTAGAEEVATFLATLDSPRPLAIAGRGALSLALRNPSRHIHVMGDDAPYPVKVHRTTVRADPMALPVAFFRVSEGVRV